MVDALLFFFLVLLTLCLLVERQRITRLTDLVNGPVFERSEDILRDLQLVYERIEADREDTVLTLTNHKDAFDVILAHLKDKVAPSQDSSPKEDF